MIPHTYKNIIFDFDGVILDSISIRTDAFAYTLRGYPSDLVNKLIEYHLYHGGLSRFHKFQYFFDNLLHQELSEEKMQMLLADFSSFVKNKLTDKSLLIKDTIDYIINNHKKQQFFIASGSEQEELRYICYSLDIDHFFVGIFGSPTHKTTIVANIIQNYSLSHKETVMIGDSINDLEAAKSNHIGFFGYNNPELKSAQGYGSYLDSFNDIHL